MNKKYKLRLGRVGESLALYFLKKEGFQLIDRNYLTRMGELDLVLKKKKEIQFIEVKTRVSPTYGQALEAATPEKMKRFYKSAEVFCSEHPEYKNFVKKISLMIIDLKKSQFELEFIEDIKDF